MPYRLRPRLLNGRYHDPVIYLPFQFEKRALLFDLGTIDRLTNHQLSQVTDIFISHTHMDHFTGFDHAVRSLLQRDKRLCLYGPRDFLKHVGHHLAGYSWNLSKTGGGGLEIHAHETLSPSAAKSQVFRFNDHFTPGPVKSYTLQNGLILDDADVRVTTALLDHRLSCLAYRVTEQPQDHILKSRLDELGLRPGHWLTHFRQALHHGLPPDTMIAVADNATAPKRRLDDLKDAITHFSNGKSYAYVVDCQFSQENLDKILPLIHGVDILFIEAGFMKKDAELAWGRYHLTTEQAGFIAGRAGVKQIEPLHFSTRYENQEDDLLAEVQAAYHASKQGLLVLAPPPAN